MQTGQSTGQHVGQASILIRSNYCLPAPDVRLCPADADTQVVAPDIGGRGGGGGGGGGGGALEGEATGDGGCGGGEEDGATVSIAEFLTLVCSLTELPVQEMQSAHLVILLNTTSK